VTKYVSEAESPTSHSPSCAPSSTVPFENVCVSLNGRIAAHRLAHS